jgi:hypothetical protein
MDSEQLNSIITRVREGTHTQTDMMLLHSLLKDGDREVKLQIAKYNINITDGKNIHIGDQTSHTIAILNEL